MTFPVIRQLCPLLIFATSTTILAASESIPCTEVSDAFSVSTPVPQWKRLQSVPMTLSDNYEGEAKDFSGKVALAWNSHGLLIAVFIKDPAFNPADSMSGFWDGDSIQVGVCSGDITSYGESRANSVLIGAAAFPFGRKVMVTTAPNGFQHGVVDVPFEFSFGEHESSYRLQLPWQLLPKLSPLSQDTFHINVIVNQNNGSKRLGWLQLSDGIGDGIDFSKFSEARISRKKAHPQIHLISPPETNLSEPFDLHIDLREVSKESEIQISFGDIVTKDTVREYSKAEKLSIKMNPRVEGEQIPIEAAVFDKAGKRVASSQTRITVLNPASLQDQNAKTKEAIEIIRKKLEGKLGQSVCTRQLQISLNCIRYALAVAEMLDQKRTTNSAQSGPTKIYKSAVTFAYLRSKQILAGLNKSDSSEPTEEKSVIDYSLPWSIKDGNIICDGRPIVLSGVVWAMGPKDELFSLPELGMRMQTIDVGPRDFVTKDYETIANLMEKDVVGFNRRLALAGQADDEVFELHTSPHYTPDWFPRDNHNAWFSTENGRRLLAATYKGQKAAFGDIKAIRAADLANEWTYWSTSLESMEAFKGWLERKYKTISVLNERWGSKFETFDAIPAPFESDAEGVYQPLHPFGIYLQRAPYWDWSSFNTEQAAEVVSWMQTAFKTEFPDLLTQIKCVLSSKAYRTLADNFLLGIDPEKILPITDTIGTDASYVRGSYWKSTLFAYDFLQSICPDKPIVCTESHQVPYDDAAAPGEIRRGTFQRFIHGERINLNFLMVSLQRPDLWSSDFEKTTMGTWNIGAAPWTLEALALTGTDLERLAEELAAFSQRAYDCRIFYDAAADFGVPGPSSTLGQYGEHALKVYESLIGRDLRIGFVTEKMLINAPIETRLIVFAGANYISDEAVSALKKQCDAGIFLLFVGENMGFDEYGKARDTRIINDFKRSPNVVWVDQVSALDKNCWNEIFKQVGVNEPFKIESDKIVEAGQFDVRSASTRDGRKILFIGNTGDADATCAISGFSSKDHLIDLISGEKVSARELHIKRNDVMLLTKKCENEK